MLPYCILYIVSRVVTQYLAGHKSHLSKGLRSLINLVANYSSLVSCCRFLLSFSVNFNPNSFSRSSRAYIVMISISLPRNVRQVGGIPVYIRYIVPMVLLNQSMCDLGRTYRLRGFLATQIMLEDLLDGICYCRENFRC